MRQLRTGFVAVTAAFVVAGAVFGQAIPARRRQPAQPAADPVAEQAKRRQMKEILAKWEAKSAALNSLALTIKRVDVALAWGNKEEYVGRAYLQAPDLANLEFWKVDTKKKPPVYVPHEQIICTGKHILQYTFPTQQIFVYPIAKEVRKRALEEGPLPFLFRLRAVDAEARYDMTLLAEDEKVYLVRVGPRWDSDRSAFSQAYVSLSKETFLPDKLRLVMPNERDFKEYAFNDIKRNERIDPGFFRGVAKKGWKVVENNNAPPAPAAAAAAPGRAAPPAPAPNRR